VVCAVNKIALPTLAIALTLIGGCRPAGPLGWAGITLSPPASWRPVAPTATMAPGVALAAWSGPDGSSLVLYRTLPAPGGSAKMIGEALANRLANLPGLKVVVHRTETVGETTAARVEVVAPGTGDALAPSGSGDPTAPAGKSLVATREVTLGFHRPNATLFLTWDIPESSYAQVADEIKTTLESVRFTAVESPSFSGY
jgi:hypothetical protein